jgi:hypothetical protein
MSLAIHKITLGGVKGPKRGTLFGAGLLTPPSAGPKVSGLAWGLETFCQPGGKVGRPCHNRSRVVREIIAGWFLSVGGQKEWKSLSLAVHKIT